MTEDLKGKRASLWHAYTALREQGKDKENAVAKGQLKVLTHSLATRVGLTDVENQLDEQFKKTGHVEFDDYARFLAEALFSRLVDGSTGSVRPDALDGVDEVCWFVCAKTYCVSQDRLLNADDVYKLWRVFNALAETVDEVGSSEAAVPVAVHPDELELIVQRLGVILRTAVHVDAAGRASNFAEFLRAIETSCLAGKNAGVVSSAVGELYDDIIANVLKKGYLYRRGGYGVTANNERAWYVLTPIRLRVYAARDERDKKTELVISRACQVVDLPDKAGLALGGIGIGVKTNRFTVRFSDDSSKPIQLYADDAQTKSEWLQAFRTASEWSSSVPLSRHGVELRRRRTVRTEREAREREETQRKKDDEERMQRTLKELEEQRQAREEAERRCREDAQRIEELQQLHGQLEELLEAERQAKRDEELVRNLQATVLQEEFEKREQLEELKQSLEELLQQEQMKSSELEERKREQEKMLAEEQERLENLEQQRQMRDKEYEMAVAKLSEAERAKEQMESELKRKEQELQKRTGARFRLAGAEDAAKVCVSHRGLGAFPRADMTWRRKADEMPTSQPDQQVPVEEDPVAAASSTTPAHVDAGCPSCPEDNTPPDVAAEAQSAADDVEQSDEQTLDEITADDDAAQQLQPATSSLAADNTEQLQGRIINVAGEAEVSGPGPR